MTVLFPMPDQQLLMHFIYESNLISQVDITLKDVVETLGRSKHHPGAAGHFTAIMYALDMVRKHDFPTRHPIEFENPEQSDKNLEWLRKLHLIIMKPFIQENPDKPMETIKPYDCSNFRITPLASFPDPKQIKMLLHFWHKELCLFHNKWKPTIDKGALTIPQTKELGEFARKMHLQLVCISPWTRGNGRVARVLENMLRLRWGLPWKKCYLKDKLEYTYEIKDFEDSTSWQTLLKSLQPNNSSKHSE